MPIFAFTDDAIHAADVGVLRARAQALHDFAIAAALVVTT
jgi:hypothetical protein